ncbi:MAG: 16S rRNA (adenine(1518)-N(6)/adenine(1519)-N(6))-dimethyltransferase RsmA [Clostridia bacterium]|nr:16S rRNA (adenine(1518)-N(6)/adenine(1519)-N(6))-dimethyltransferase RsmA [Clostridia bacterium]
MDDFKEILQSCGFSFKKQWGQNFLTDANLLRAIVSDAGVTEETTALEIGAGAGALTRALSERAKRVVAYEMDRALQPVRARTLAGCENAEVVLHDFAKEKLAPLEAALGDYTVVANLPYYVTTPIVLRFVEEARLCRGLTVMVQEEVAERFCAAAGTADYGAVTAAIARRGSAKITRRVPRTMFTPRPNVDSAVVRIDFGEGGFDVVSPHAYRETVRCAFLSRRKTLENNFVNVFRLPRERVKELLRSAGIADGVRGETLTPRELGTLSDLLVSQGVIET